MAYDTRLTGAITITPPLTWEEFRDDPFRPPTNPNRDVRLRVREEPVDVPGGQLVGRTADAIVPARAGPYAAYNAVQHVQDIVDRYGHGHLFTGRLDAQGESAGDLWRLMVQDGRAVRVAAVTVWPDDLTDHMGRFESALNDPAFRGDTLRSATTAAVHATGRDLLDRIVTLLGGLPS